MKRDKVVEGESGKRATDNKQRRNGLSRREDGALHNAF